MWLHTTIDGIPLQPSGKLQQRSMRVVCAGMCVPPGDDNYPNSGCKFTPSGTLESKKLVIGITIDESGSVGRTNFETAKNSVAAFIKDATDACAPPRLAPLCQALTRITSCISFWLPTLHRSVEWPCP